MASSHAASRGDGQLRVAEALQAMATAVRSGDMEKARGIGERCVVPLNLAAADLGMAGKLSEGAESTIFRGWWKERNVVLKKVRIATSADLNRFRRELDVLSRLNHPAVVPLMGARALPPDYMMVLPMAAGGNVRNAVYERGWRPSWRQLLELAYSVASGMEHVHAAGIIHRDLKPANLLLVDPLSPPPPLQWQTSRGTCSDIDKDCSTGGGGGRVAATDGAMDVSAVTDTDSRLCSGGNSFCSSSGLRVQIADFGISALVDGHECGGAAAEAQGFEYLAHPADKIDKPSGGFYKRMMAGTLEYMAPELLMRTSPASRASDVYAWAITINEVATGVVPFSDCTKDNPEVHTVLEMGYGRLQLAAAVCTEGLRPLLPRRCPPGFVELMRACWQADPAERPTFCHVMKALEGLADAVVHWEAEEAAMHELQLHQGPRQPAVGTTLELKMKSQKPHQPPLEGQIQPKVVVSAVATFDDNNSESVWSAGEGVLAQTMMDSNAPIGTSAPHEVATTAAASPTGLQVQEQQQQLKQDWPSHEAVRPFVLCSGEEGEDFGGDSSSRDNVIADGSYSCLAEALKAESAALAMAVGAGTHGLIFRAGMFEAIGPRDSMEDRCVLLPEVPTTSAVAGCATVTMPLVAVFDGHRGADAAEFCRTRLGDVLWSESQQCRSPAAALRRTFLRLETEYYSRWQQQQRRGGSTSVSRFPGTTALVVLRAPGGRLMVANAGDCRAVVCRGRRALAASRDHTALLEDERRRLAVSNTAVTWQHGGWRIGTSGLQVTRCIGDFDVKPGGHSAISTAGVTALPEITSLELSPQDHFVILATDGLWDVVSAQEAVGLVYDTVKDPTLAAKRLVTEALMRGSADNVSAIVVFLAPVDTFERVYGAEEGEAFEITGTVYGSRVRLVKDRHFTASADEARDTY